MGSRVYNKKRGRSETLTGQRNDRISIDREEYSTAGGEDSRGNYGRFGPKRAAADELAYVYEHLEEQRSGELRFSQERRIQAVRECGTYLEFHVQPDAAKLHAANFCKDRLCPLCNWRRSLKMYGQISQVMNLLEKQGYRYIFNTFTVRNMPGEKLSQGVDLLQKGWNNLYHVAPYIGKKKVIQGTLRILEVIYP